MREQAGSTHAATLDAMILRAEAACERYRLRAEEKGRAPPFVRKRYEILWSMQAILERLQAQRAAEDTVTALLQTLDAAAAAAEMASPADGNVVKLARRRGGGARPEAEAVRHSRLQRG